MAPVGSAVIFVDHNSTPHDALVITSNADHTVDVLLVSEDPKKRNMLSSADFSLGLERKMTVEHAAVRLARVLTEENAKARAEQRDAKLHFEHLMRDGGYFAHEHELAMHHTDEQGLKVVSFHVDIDVEPYRHVEDPSLVPASIETAATGLATEAGSTPSLVPAPFGTYPGEVANLTETQLNAPITPPMYGAPHTQAVVGEDAPNMPPQGDSNPDVAPVPADVADELKATESAAEAK